MIKKIFATGYLFLLCGCFGSTPNSQFYLLETGQNLTEISDKKINLAIQNVSVPDYLDRAQIVLQKPDSTELNVAEFNRWASDLSSMLQNVLINDLQVCLPQAVIKPLAFGQSNKYVVKINIEKLNGWLNDKAYLNGSWQILTPQGRIIAEHDFNLTRIVGKSYNSYVQAQSQMLAELTQELAARIARLK